jgi:hypothetical protein
VRRDLKQEAPERRGAISYIIFSPRCDIGRESCRSSVIAGHPSAGDTRCKTTPPGREQHFPHNRAAESDLAVVLPDLLLGLLDLVVAGGAAGGLLDPAPGLDLAVAGGPAHRLLDLPLHAPDLVACQWMDLPVVGVQMRASSASAICTVLSAAPLRRLSPETNSANPDSTAGSRRMRPT